jgi:hypothetical protein
MFRPTIARTFVIFILLGVAGFGKGTVGGTKAASSLADFLKLYAYFPVQFQRDDNEPFLLAASIGGKKVKLIVDTGCGFTTIDPRSAPNAKTLRELGSKLHDSLLGEISEPSVLLLADLAVGPAHFFNQPARPETLSAEHVTLRFDGLLGVDFLARNFCIIDCGGRQIFFRGAKPTHEQQIGIEKSLRDSGYTATPIQPGKRLILNGTIRGQPAGWIVDTGARYTFLGRERAFTSEGEAGAENRHRHLYTVECGGQVHRSAANRAWYASTQCRAPVGSERR